MTASQAYRRAAAAGGKSHPGLASCEAADVQRARSGRPELLPGLVDVGFWVHVHRGDADELPRLEGGRPGPQPGSPAERARVNITRPSAAPCTPGISVAERTPCRVPLLAAWRKLLRWVASCCLGGAEAGKRDRAIRA